MSRSLVPIEVISDDICADLGDSNSRFKFSVLRKIMAGWRELNLYVDQSFCVKTAVLQVDNVVALPDDFVYLTKVGLRKNGVIATLTLDTELRKQSLTQLQSQQQLNQVWDGDYVGESFTFYNYYSNGGLGELYGLGGSININGFYNIDQSKGEIYLGSLVPEDAELVIEYKSSGAEGLNLIPIQYWNCLKYYALSEYFLVTAPQKAELYRSWYEREYNKNQRLNNFRSALFMANQAQSNYKSSPR